MKKIHLVIIVCFISLCSHAQEHISFNGATFGVERNSFISSINKESHFYTITIYNHTYKDVYERLFLYHGKINTYRANYYIHSSLKTNKVFEVIAWFGVDNLKEELMLFVKGLEAKYGDHIKEKPEDLGVITDTDSQHNSRCEYREMLALKYIIRSPKTNKDIGEVRISAAPRHSPTFEGDSGYIELTYRDYSAAESAIAEYEATIGSIL